MADPYAWRLLTNRLFSPFRLFVAREAQVALVLSPKVATTYIRDILSMAHMEVTGAYDPSEGRLAFLKRARRMPVAPLADYRHFMAQPSAYRIYGIVRDPYRRLSSAWRNKFLDPFEKYGSDLSKYPRSMREGELRKVQVFARKAGLQGQTAEAPVPFSTFMAFVEYQRPGRRNHHWEDQWRILFHDDLPYTEVFRMEEGLEAPLKATLAPIGLSPEWVEARTARPAGQTRANQSSRAVTGDFTDELAAQASQIFAQDFSRFGYDVDDWRGK